MALDYTSGCVNLRDAGGYVNLITGSKCLPEGKLLRGGSINYVREHSQIEYVKTIINLRNAPDPEYFDADYLHFPAENKMEIYDTTNKEVCNWLNNVIKTFENSRLRYPVLIHCLSGKDRTGIVIAALLLILGINTSAIIEEYLLSEGDLNAELLKKSMEGFKDLDSYFKNCNLEIIRNNILKV